MIDTLIHDEVAFLRKFEFALFFFSFFSNGQCIGKGSLWTIDHEARAGLVQQLRKTAAYNAYPYTKTAYSSNR